MEGPLQTPRGGGVLVIYATVRIASSVASLLVYWPSAGPSGSFLANTYGRLTCEDAADYLFIGLEKCVGSACEQ